MIAQQRAAAKRGAAFGDFSGDAGTGHVAKKAAPQAAAAAAGDRVDATGGVGVEVGAGVGSAAQGALFVGDADRAAAVVAAQEGVAVEEEEEEEGVPLSFTQRWKRRVTFVARTVQIWAFLFHVLIKLLRQKLVQRDEARMSARRRKLGRYLCKAFLKLGPTFIKIGQVGYCQEMEFGFVWSVVLFKTAAAYTRIVVPCTVYRSINPLSPPPGASVFFSRTRCPRREQIGIVKQKKLPRGENPSGSSYSKQCSRHIHPRLVCSSLPRRRVPRA